jgi:hypothetical protein
MTNTEGFILNSIGENRDREKNSQFLDVSIGCIIQPKHQGTDNLSISFSLSVFFYSVIGSLICNPLAKWAGGNT